MNIHVSLGSRRYDARAPLIFTLLLTACSSGGRGSDAAGTTAPDASSVAGTEELRTTLRNEGIECAGDADPVTEELFELGRALFFDKELSGNRDVSCATCHWPELATADARTLPRGVGGVGLGAARTGGAIVPRNSPAVLNTHRQHSQFWDGRIEGRRDELRTPAGAALTAEMVAIFDKRWRSLAAQAMFPPLSRAEMRGAVGANELADIDDAKLASIWDALRDRLIALPGYQRLMMAAYPDLQSIGAAEFAHAANAIAAFETRAFSRHDSPFERFVGGDGEAMTEQQVRGGREFFGRAGCAQCHRGRRFTNGGFHNIGLPQLGPGQGDGIAGHEDFGRERVTGVQQDRYRFRTPSLLNVELTAPYGHAGQYATLESFVGHYTDPARRLREYDIFANVRDPDLTGTLVDNRELLLQNLDRRLRGARPFDVAAVVAFLGALTADSARDMRDLIPTSVPSGIPVR